MKLKNCPFCDSDSLKPVIQPDSQGPVYRVVCQRCNTEGPRTVMSKKQSELLWNRRVLKPKKIKKVDLPYWNICSECAEKKGGKLPAFSCNTVTFGDCPYCNAPNATLTPITDFNWSDGTKAVWD